MPRAGTNAAGRPDLQEKRLESEKRAEAEERVELDDDNDPEETMEEEVEYEEVIEEIEEEEEEEEEEEIEVEEEVEEEEEEEVEEENEEAVDSRRLDVDEDEENKHAELLSLPPHGSEVYLGGIPHDASESDLRGFCETVGEVTEVRIIKGKDSSESKRYAFVTFRTKELASNAIAVLNNTELKGSRVKCSSSQANNRLFIGNVPRSWEEQDMRAAVEKIGPGIINVKLLKDLQNSSRNRGFAFIEYYNHACADYSRKKMLNSEFMLDGNAPTVSWADTKNAGSSAVSQVKAIYVKNLPKDISEDRLRQLFERHGEVTQVVLPPAKPGHENSRFGFVHFEERASAMKALKNTEKYEIAGQVLDCSLARPQADQRISGGLNTPKSALLHPSYPPRLGYGLVPPPYGAMGAGYPATGFAQPMIFGGGATPANMAMMPMLLPDGRIGYVLQQPTMQLPGPPRGQGGRGGGASTSGGWKRGSNSRGRGRYNPY